MPPHSAPSPIDSANSSENEQAKTSPMILANNSAAPSVQYSAHGIMTAPSSIVANTTSPTNGAPPSTSNPWSLAIQATIVVQVSPSPEIPPQAKKFFTENSSSMPKAKTSSLVSVPPNQLPNFRSKCLKYFANFKMSATPSKVTSTICKISNLPSNKVAFSCCRPVTENAQASPPFVSPSKWLKKS